MKKLIMYIIIAVLLVILPIVVGYLAIITGAIFMFMPEPPKPEITYGEFPIRITYEIDGEIKVLEDTIICEYDGVKNYGSGGKQRQWKSYLKSGNERLILIRKETDNLVYEISDDYGFPAEYYMGDFKQRKESYEEAAYKDKYLGYIQWENGVRTGVSILKDEVWEKYKLRIIDVQYSQPIKNSFE